jgi:hypothetical protein
MFKFFSQWFYTTHDIHNEKEQPSGGVGTILNKKTNTVIFFQKFITFHPGSHIVLL